MALSTQQFKRSPDQPYRQYYSPRIVSISRQPSNQALMWLVTNPQDIRHYSTVSQVGETLYCACQEGQAGLSPCPHIRAVQTWLNAHRQQGYDSTSPENAQESERTLSWSDDKAFSIWKS